MALSAVSYLLVRKRGGMPLPRRAALVLLNEAEALSTAAGRLVFVRRDSDACRAICRAGARPDRVRVESACRSGQSTRASARRPCRPLSSKGLRLGTH